MAIGFGQVGVSVIAVDVNLSGAETTAETIRAEGGSAEAMKLDVTRREQCFDLAAAVKRSGVLSISSSTAQGRPSAVQPKNFRKRSSMPSSR